MKDRRKKKEKLKKAPGKAWKKFGVELFGGLLKERIIKKKTLKETD